jgi:hypothetical protein
VARILYISKSLGQVVVVDTFYVLETFLLTEERKTYGQEREETNATEEGY